MKLINNYRLLLKSPARRAETISLSLLLLIFLAFFLLWELVYDERGLLSYIGSPPSPTQLPYPRAFPQRTLRLLSLDKDTFASSYTSDFLQLSRSSSFSRRLPQLSHHLILDSQIPDISESSELFGDISPFDVAGFFFISPLFMWSILLIFNLLLLCLLGIDDFLHQLLTSRTHDPNSFPSFGSISVFLLSSSLFNKKYFQNRDLSTPTFMMGKHRHGWIIVPSSHQATSQTVDVLLQQIAECFVQAQLASSLRNVGADSHHLSFILAHETSDFRFSWGLSLEDLEQGSIFCLSPFFLKSSMVHW
jgi:hypothetical protein